METENIDTVIAATSVVAIVAIGIAVGIMLWTFGRKIVVRAVGGDRHW